MAIDLVSYNRQAWNNEVKQGNEWTVPVTGEQLEQARNGIWEIVLTPTKPVPRSWFCPLENAAVLCLASGGGQQGPILAAAGADVTVFDNSDAQLERDRSLSEAYNLGMRTVQGDMRDLSCFTDSQFDLIFHPVSNLFIDNPIPVWEETFRVLKPGGILLAGFCNPIIFLFPEERTDSGNLLRAVNSLPYSDLTHLGKKDLEKRISSMEPIEFGHTLTQQISGQLEAGFMLTGMFEDSSHETRLERLTDTFIATRALKPKGAFAE
jgi:SAM-dependent methyltransferase